MSASSRSSAAGWLASSFSSRAMSARSASRWALTDTNSPTAIDIAPAARPATPAIRMAPRSEDAEATPIIRLDVETIASLEPSTAARSQPARALWWRSGWRFLRLMKEPLSETRSAGETLHLRLDVRRSGGAKLSPGRAVLAKSLGDMSMFGHLTQVLARAGLGGALLCLSPSLRAEPVAPPSD